MIKSRVARLALLILLALTVTGCENPLGAILSTRVFIVGPDQAYGREAVTLPHQSPKYLCEYNLTIRAESLTEEKARIRWAGAHVVTRTMGGEVLTEETLSAQQVGSLFGRTMSAGSTRTSGVVRIYSSEPHFQVAYTLSYYDEEFGNTMESQFRSRCTVRQ